MTRARIEFKMKGPCQVRARVYYCRICGQRINENEFDEYTGLCAICRDSEEEEIDGVLF